MGVIFLDFIYRNQSRSIQLLQIKGTMRGPARLCRHNPTDAGRML